MPVAVVIPGHAAYAGDGVYRISARCRQLVAEAEKLAATLSPAAVVFSGGSRDGGPSEAEQMRDAWRGPAVELVVEPTAASTAENAARTLPLLLEREVGRAVVVCAPQHLFRTRVLFRLLYQGSGIEVAFRAARLAPTLRSVAWELLALPFLPLQLRIARAELERRRQ